MNDNVKIPMSILSHDFEIKLLELVNTSQLPPFVAEQILKNVLHEVSVMTQQEIELETKMYKEKLQTENNKTSK